MYQRFSRTEQNVSQLQSCKWQRQTFEAALQKLKSGIIGKLLSEQFSHCFNSYVQAFNKTNDRMGSCW